MGIHLAAPRGIRNCSNRKVSGTVFRRRLFYLKRVPAAPLTGNDIRSPIHIGGLVYFAGLPAIRDGSAVTALVNGALIGLIAYACYEMTSYTIMRDWHINLVLTDMAWGVVISGLSAWLGALAGLWGRAR